MPAYKPLRYTDVAEKLERALKDPIYDNVNDVSASEMLTVLLCLPIQVVWVKVARGWVPRVTQPTQRSAPTGPRLPFIQPK